MEARVPLANDVWTPSYHLKFTSRLAQLPPQDEKLVQEIRAAKAKIPPKRKFRQDGTDLNFYNEIFQNYLSNIPLASAAGTIDAINHNINLNSSTTKATTTRKTTTKATTLTTKAATLTTKATTKTVATSTSTKKPHNNDNEGDDDEKEEEDHHHHHVPSHQITKPDQVPPSEETGDTIDKDTLIVGEIEIREREPLLWSEDGTCENRLYSPSKLRKLLIDPARKL